MHLLEAGTSAIDFSSFDFSSLLPTLTAAVTVAIPVVIGVLAVRKGIQWVLGFIRRS